MLSHTAHTYVPTIRRLLAQVDGEIAWVPGVATGERFRVTEATG